MLERINAAGFESLSQPSPDALEVLRRLLEVQPSATVAEVGVGIGATSIEMVKMMGGKGSLHLFDFEDRVSELAADLRNSEFCQGLEIVEHGNSRKTFDSYAWTLASMVLSMRNAGQSTEAFDFVYLDGAHSYQYDAPSCVILKEMIKPGGYLVFDDMYWSFMKSPVMNPTKKPDIKNHYSDEQLEQPHIEMVVKLFMETDARFKQVYLNDNKRPYRPVFQRLKEQTPSRRWKLFE